MDSKKTASLIKIVMDEWLKEPPWCNMSAEEIARRLTIQILRLLPKDMRGNFSESGTNGITSKEIETYYREKNQNEIYRLKRRDNEYIDLPYFIPINVMRNYINGKTPMNAIALAAFCSLHNKTTDDFFRTTLDPISLISHTHIEPGEFLSNLDSEKFLFKKDDAKKEVANISKQFVNTSSEVNISYNYFNLNWEEKINKTTHDIFISGVVLHKLSNASTLLEHLDDKKTLRLLTFDIEDKDLLMQYCKMRYTNENYKEKGEELLITFKNTYNLLHGETISKRMNIIERVSKRPMSCAFIAIDCGIDTDSNTDSFVTNENSSIEVYYYLTNTRADKGTISFTAVAGTELFDKLKKQIEFLWKEAVETERERLKRAIAGMKIPSKPIMFRVHPEKIRFDFEDFIEPK